MPKQTKAFEQLLEELRGRRRPPGVPSENALPITIYGVAVNSRCHSVVEKVMHLVSDLDAEIRWKDLRPCLKGEESLPPEESKALRQRYEECGTIPMIGIGDEIYSYAPGMRRLQQYRYRELAVNHRHGHRQKREQR